MPRIATHCFLLLSLVALTVEGGRFTGEGPVLTVTLKDASSASKQGEVAGRMDMAQLRPSILYSLNSQEPPLPKWLPSLKSLQTAVGYRYDEKHLPTFIEATAKFDAGRSIQIQVQPSHEFASCRTNLLIQAARGANYAFARFSQTQRQAPRLEQIKASRLLVFASSVSAIRITPCVDIQRRHVSCNVEAVAGGGGGAGRTTKAILNLEYERPTLAIQYQPDERNLIRPQIDLFSGKIVYQWVVALSGGGTIQTTVDPSDAVEVTWTDPYRGSGSWITDVRVPLDDESGGVSHHLSADVRVRRQFRF